MEDNYKGRLTVKEGDKTVADVPYTTWIPPVHRIL